MADLKTTLTADTSKHDRSMMRAADAVEDYTRALEDLELELAKIERQFDDDMAKAAKKNEDALRKQRDAAGEVGEGMLKAGAAIGAGLALAANEAVKWESAWAGVEKTTDGSPEQMAALEGELRQLAKTLPATHEEIAAVAEAAGQLGVKRGDIAAFTKTMIDMSVSTNLTADEAATGMARFANVMGTPIKNIDRLGATIVALGNAGASTEKDILEMALRISAAGRQAGLSEDEVLALANALSSVGIEAEAGGSAISTILIKISQAVTSGGDAVEGFATVAGTSAAKFSAQWRKDPTAALLAFEKGLAGVKASGGDVFGILEDLGITEIRQRDAVLRLAGANTVLGDSLKTGATAWRENTALVDEANKRYASTESQMKIAQNQLADFAITLGETLLPIIGAFAETASGMLDFFGAMPGPVKVGVVVLASLATIIGVVGGAALVAAPKIAAFKEVLSEAGGVGGVAKRGLSSITSFLFGPWGIALGGATLALGLFADKHAESQDRIRQHIDALKAEQGALGDANRQIVANALEQQGALKDAESLGLSLELVTRAAYGDVKAKKLLNAELEKLRGNMNGSSDAMNEAIDTAYDPLADKIGNVRRAVNGQNGEIEKAVGGYRRMAEATGEAAGEADTAAGSTKNLAVEQQKAAEAAAAHEQEIKDLIASYNALTDTALAISGGEMAFEAAIDAATEAVKQNGKTIDINTEKGRANKQALDAIASATSSLIETNAEMGASNEDLQELQDRGIAQFYKAALAMTGSKAAADRLTQAYFGIPGSVMTELQADKKDADSKIKQLESQLKKTRDKKTVAKINADIRAAQAKAIAIQRQIDRLHGKNVNVNINRYDTTFYQDIDLTKTTRGGRVSPRVRRGLGGPVMAGVTYRVGELGEEEFRPAQNGWIVPNHQLRIRAGEPSSYPWMNKHTSKPFGDGPVQLVLHNHGIIASKRDAENWLAGAVDDLQRKGRI